MRTHNTNLLQVQLTEAEKRHIKTLAVSQGLTLRQATLHAFQAWEFQLQSRARPADLARGAVAGEPKRNATRRQQQRPAQGKSASTLAAGAALNPERPSRAWLRQAAQVDWSKCPAVESAQGKSGRIWMVRGTDAPLAEILHAVAEGRPFLEIAEVFEITLQQLIAVLQFAAERAAPAGLTTEAHRTES
jgi:uncharacterized protein (DUF433 family)